MESDMALKSENSGKNIGKVEEKKAESNDYGPASKFKPFIV